MMGALWLYFVVGISSLLMRCRRRENTDWFGLMIMCPSGTTCLPADCCSTELGLYIYMEPCCCILLVFSTSKCDVGEEKIMIGSDS